MDLYTADYRSDLFNATWITVSKIIPYEFTIGVVITGKAEKLVQHFRDYIGNETTVVTEILQRTTQETEVTYKNSETIVFKLLSVERVSSCYRTCGAASVGGLTC